MCAHKDSPSWVDSPGANDNAIGSWPYGDPEYHAEGDIPERCDVKNAALTVQATLAAVVTLDQGL